MEQRGAALRLPPTGTEQQPPPPAGPIKTTAPSSPTINGESTLRPLLRLEGVSEHWAPQSSAFRDAGSTKASFLQKRRMMVELGQEPAQVFHDPSRFCPNLLQLLADFSAVDCGGGPFVALSRKNNLEQGQGSLEESTTT
ncbi:hypothetical protein MAPG_11304 [Magnaporthiopsis poae ATCC 64411]|uniref:Uncharacterized protein n=1 Tax=Magnaporthiopsis poae (strain ATCC 64411 / 73-15) TaxID=644358 RepID=A0A0C4EEX2_MAGP6|nr:hypothetical protein MAPG_11304 [Magnaporthiopsis poae ATCC 64411]